MTASIHAYLDEFGDTDVEVEKGGPTEFFIITALLVEDHRLSSISEKAEAIRERFFQQGEMKSNGIRGRRDSRRLALLGELNALEVPHFSFACPKVELSRKGGFAHKGTFFKYLYRRMYERLLAGRASARVIADEHGSEEFMASFRRYFAKHFPQSLFVSDAFRFANSRDEVLLQVADIYSGSIARGLDPTTSSTRPREVFEAARKNSIDIHVWPIEFHPGSEANAAGSASEDEAIKHYSLGKAIEHLRSQPARPSSDELELARSLVLEHLLFSIQFGEENKFFPNEGLREQVEAKSGIRLSPQQLQSAVIAKLRDSGVIIASSSQGYKLPTSLADVSQYVAHTRTVVEPMLNRLASARSSLRIATADSVDILSDEHSRVLRSTLEAFTDARDRLEST